MHNSFAFANTWGAPPVSSATSGPYTLPAAAREYSSMSPTDYLGVWHSGAFLPPFYIPPNTVTATQNQNAATSFPQLVPYNQGWMGPLFGVPTADNCDGRFGVGPNFFQPALTHNAAAASAQVSASYGTQFGAQRTSC